MVAVGCRRDGNRLIYNFSYYFFDSGNTYSTIKGKGAMPLNHHN